jgi:hypothetical protein
LKENDEHVARRKELDQAWQDQLEQDMNAVCSICNDGEVTPENQILFCEACNVAVHQNCYGVVKVPDGDYYCLACRYFKRDEQIQAMAGSKRFKDPTTAPRTTLPPLPIVCELCPVKQGAFIRTQTKSSTANSSSSKWIHMACAKWHGLDFVPKDDPSPSLVEDVSTLKRHFLMNRTSCCICKGMRGAYYPCQFEGCTNWCHVTCASETRICEVVYGEDVEGVEIKGGWQLKCPEHSNVKEIEGETKKDAVSVDYLIKAAREFPSEPEPLPSRPNKPFTALTSAERKLALLDNEYEQELIKEVMTKKICGFHCEVCDVVDDNGKSLARCTGCNAVVCFGCQFIDDPDMQSERHFLCIGCRSISSGEDPPTQPQCSLCNQKGGLLAWASATPINKKTYRKNNPKGSKKSLFETTRYAHILCSFWSKHIILHPLTGSIDTSNTVLSNGRGHIQDKYRCGLCGLKTGLKTKCSNMTCRARGERRSPYHFHITCARQAGLEVAHKDDHDPEYAVHCYVHGSNDYNFRAKLEDLLIVEKKRAGKRFWKSDSPMKFNDACRLMNKAIVVMRVLGWAWRWAEWWVEYGSTWEPLLEEGQVEAKMTAEQLRIVASTKESRCEDARRCRLAAFGAALRNRAYDTAEEGFDNSSLDRALRAVLHTPSLVGPLDEHEIEFYAEWLGRAYRSKSKLLGYGEHKIPVAKDGFCLHANDKSPKFDLGKRSLPGKENRMAGQIFAFVTEPDDYLRPEQQDDGTILDVLPIEEVNYKHHGMDESKIEVPFAPKEQPKNQERHQTVHEDQTEEGPPKKKSKGSHHSRTQRSGDNLTSTTRKVVNTPFLEAIISRKIFEAPLNLIQSRGRPPNEIRLSIFITIGGEVFHPPSDKLHDEKDEEAIDDPSDYSNIELFDVLPDQKDFFLELGINQACELMSSLTCDISEKYIEWRREKGAGRFKGKNDLETFAKQVSSWKSKVKEAARNLASEFVSGLKSERNSASETMKARLASKVSNSNDIVEATSRGASRSMQRAKQEQRLSLEADIISTDAVEEKEDNDNEQSNEKRRKAHVTSESKEDTANALPSRPKSRDRKRQRQASDVTKNILESMEGQKDHAEQNVISAAEENRSEMSPVRSLKRQKVERASEAKSISVEDHPSTPRRRSKSVRPSGDLLFVLPESASEFLSTIDVTNARSFLETATGDVAGKYAAWRKETAQPKLAGTGATAIISSWKGKIRKAAEDAGDIKLASLNKSRKGRRKREKAKENRSGAKDDDHDDEDHDECEICQDGGDLMICDGCDASYHTTCLDPPLETIPDGEWYCPRCEDDDICVICQDGGDLLICDGCEQPYHTSCLDPPLEEIPEDDWFCPECSSKQPATNSDSIRDKKQEENESVKSSNHDDNGAESSERYATPKSADGIEDTQQVETSTETAVTT